MPFDNTPSEGSGGGSNDQFWQYACKKIGFAFASLLPEVLSDLYHPPTGGCVAMWTPSDTAPHILVWRNGEPLDDNRYVRRSLSIATTIGQYPTDEKIAEAMGSPESKNFIPVAFVPTVVKNTNLFMALATNRESAPLQVAGLFTACHIFGEPLESLNPYCEQNPYWLVMHNYFSIRQIRDILGE